MEKTLEKKLITLPIDEVKNYDKNNKIHTDDGVSELVENYRAVGVVDPIFVDENNVILAGHKRLLAAKAANLANVECYQVTGLSEKQKKIYRIASNKLTHNSEWDYSNLKQELTDIENSYNIDALGIAFDLDALYPDKESAGVEQDSIPALQQKVVSQVGDLWLLGGHRLLCGDSSEQTAVNYLLGAEQPVLMVTDPPYGVEYDASWREEHNKGATAKGKVVNDDIADWSTTILLWNIPVIYMWHAAKFAVECVVNLLEAYKIISQLIWVKQHFVLSRGDYHWQHEPCWYLVRKDSTHNWQGARDQATTWQISNLNPIGKSVDEDERTDHSTQKPIECMSRPIQNNSAKGDIICDPFLGSGTTLIAAEQLKRKCYAMELNPQYVDMAIRRWQKLTGKEALREDDGATFNSLEQLHGQV